ncbi:hypothetical protein UFOVP122_26 [uncultured Caudovirales phage]|uniref:Large polyvalent protein associated domain-containing protein n=1 Tax=uncultured Caudovirales phage TaxID=2100421 RepID=A0A6J5LCB0_9CAUD|nr:hypothetical protein UFOVP122_26 [uncultured Caudovirales phage]
MTDRKATHMPPELDPAYARFARPVRRETPTEGMKRIELEMQDRPNLNPGRIATGAGRTMEGYNASVGTQGPLSAGLIGAGDPESGKPTMVGARAQAGPLSYQVTQPIFKGAPPSQQVGATVPFDADNYFGVSAQQTPGQGRTYGANVGGEGWNVSGGYNPTNKAANVNVGYQANFAEGGGVDEDTYGPSNIEERRARLRERLESEKRATAQYPGDELEAPKGYITPAKAVRWVDTDSGPMAVDAEGKPLPLIQQPGVLPLYRDPTIDSVRVAMPKLADIAGDMTGAPLGMTASRIVRAGMKGERPAANVVNIFAGESAKTADLGALETAKNMAKEGANKDEILTSTGWFKGVDDKWRFEIPDEASKMNTDPLFKQQGRIAIAQEYFGKQGVHPSKFATGQFPDLDAAALKYADDVIDKRTGTPLGELLDHPELYAAYPDAAKIPVSKNINPAYGGTFNQGTGEMTISDPGLWGDPSRPRSVALHELQHYVQGQEGFATGANTFALKHGTPAWDIYKERIKAMSTPPSLEKYAMDAGFSDLAEAKPSYDQYVKDLLKGGWKKFDTEAQKSAVMEAYQRSAGETEARNVQTRRDLAPNARRQWYPWESQSVPSDKQIVQFAKGEPQLSLSEARRKSYGYASGGRAVVGHTSAANVPVSLEEHKGEMRHRAHSGDSRMAADYGYIDSSKPDHDGMKTDAFVGPHHDSKKVFVINQQHPHTKTFNEHKVMLGYKDRAHALRDYAHSFSDGLGHKRIHSVVEMDAHQLKDWIKRPHTAPLKKAEGGEVFDLKASLGRLMQHV